MPCLHEKDLSELAEKHIQAQTANIQNQRKRLDEITDDLKQLKSNPDAEPLRVAEAENAVADLEYHLNGRVKRLLLEDEATNLEKTQLNPERLNRIKEALKSPDDTLKDPDLDTAEERAKVMEALYKERSQFVFEDTAHDKDSNGNPIPRYASVFGVPTVKKMMSAGERAIADDLMLRSISMVMGGETSRNPNDYLDTTGIEVKKTLNDGIEHHHIYNNVYVDERGRVQPNSVRFHRNLKTGDIEMEVIPEYWNSAKHGRNTQFIELMDGAHSGDDTTTHLHYYKFDDSDSDFLRHKIKDKVVEINTTNAARLPKLDAELKELAERKTDPVKYEQKLNKEIESHDTRIAQLDTIEAQYATPNKNGAMVKNKGLTDSQEQELKHARSERDVLKRVKEKTVKALDEHRTFVNMEADIKQWEGDILSLEGQAKAIKLNAKFPTADYLDKVSARAAQDKFLKEAKDLKLKIKNNKQLLREKGSVDQQIKDKAAKRQEAEQLALLSESDALAIFERSNGYFDFDKGYQESQDYSKSRPRMNAEIHKHNARESIEELEKQHGENAIKALQELAKSKYKQNLLYNLEVMVDKVAGTLS